MGLYLRNDSGDEVSLASNKGWSLFGEWVSALRDAPLLTQLKDHGWAEPVSALSAELGTAVRASPPADPAVLSTARDLLTTLSSFPQDGAVVVTDGVEQTAETNGEG